MKQRFGKFELDAVGRRLTEADSPVHLNARAFDLLVKLISRRGEVVEKEELLDAVWPNQFVEENNLSVQISALRKALGEGNGASRFIATIPGRGYSFVAPVEIDDREIIIENSTVERITVEHETDAAEQLQISGNVRNRRWLYLVASLILILGIGLVAFRYFSNKPDTKISSIAVLPFVNQTADENNEYLTDGLAESVTYSLSQMPGIRVMSRGSTFRYKGKDTNANTVGSELNVQAVLTGRVTQRGDALNISAELVSAADNSIIWGEQFTRKLSDIEKLQSDIANSISDRLRFKISGVGTPGTESAEAYQLYLKGLFYWNKRTETDLKQAVEMFQQAIERDPTYAKAHAGLALVYNVIPGNMPLTHDEANEWRYKAKAEAQKTLEIDSSSAEAHAVLGDQKRVDWDFAGAENHFLRAIELNPNLASAHQWYSEMLSRLGRHDEALAEVQKAYELDPLSPAVRMNVGLRYLGVARYDEAIGIFKKLIEQEPAYPMPYSLLGDVYVERGMYGEGIALWCKADVLLKIDSAENCAADNEKLRTALKMGGKNGFYREMLEQGMKYYERGIFTEVDIAGLYARLDDRTKTFEWLERAYAKHEERLSGLKTDRAFEGLRDDPRYHDLLRRIGLPPL